MARSPRPFDTLQLARALRDGAGFTGEHAEAAAVAIADWVDVDLVTRRDLAEAVRGLEARMESKLDLMRAQNRVATLKWMIAGELFIQTAFSFLHH